MFLSKPGRGSPRPPGGTTAEPTGFGDEVSGNGFRRPPPRPLTWGKEVHTLIACASEKGQVLDEEEETEHRGPLKHVWRCLHFLLCGRRA